MIRLRNKQTGAEIGTITEENLKFLVDHLVEEDAEDRDYYLNPATLDLLEQRDGDPAMIAMLRRAMGDAPDLEILWERAG
jgi:hypothetical protein